MIFGKDTRTHPQYCGVIAAITHKHTKVTPESPGGSEIPA
jgi:hypothetical protein